MRRFVLIICMLFSVAINKVTAADFDSVAVDSLWQLGNEAYSAQKYEEALDYYLKIEKLSVATDALYYNIGNTYYKLHYVAQPILYYERALNLNPGNEDAKYNLEVAKAFCIDKIEGVPEFFLATWFRGLRHTFSSDTWAKLSLATVAIVLLLLLGFFYLNSKGVRKVSFVFACLFFVFAISFGIFALQNRLDVTSKEYAIVISAVSSVKSSPDEQGKDLLVVHEGTKLRIKEKVGEWGRVVLSDGRQGWLQLKEIENI